MFTTSGHCIVVKLLDFSDILDGFCRTLGDNLFAIFANGFQSFLSRKIKFDEHIQLIKIYL